jgi:alkaline phosphatase
MYNSIVFLIIFILSTSLFADKSSYSYRLRGKVKNVIVLIPDGCGFSIQTLARYYKDAPLTVDKMDAGAVKTYMASSLITGSAAAATAFACGHKTTVRFLGVGPRKKDLLDGFQATAEPYAPIASVLEAAKLEGKATGLVSTSRVSHATPAGYACHIHDRGMDNEIMEHLVYNNLDVCFGGGKSYLLPKDMEGGKRTDGENLMQVLLDRGYAFVETRDELLKLDPGTKKAWGMFNMSHMDSDMDRIYYKLEEPSIAEMTKKAIEILSNDPNGFFIMIEGSQVDWAGHNNDPIWMITDFLAFDEAVKVACDFADKNGQTLVIAFPDHNCGGMDIGRYKTPYTELKKADLLDVLKGMKVTASSVVSEMKEDYSVNNVITKVKELWGVTLTENDVADIASYAEVKGWSFSLARIVSERYTHIGWTSHNHNAEDVQLWSYGKGKPEGGVLDNTDLAKHCAIVMKSDLNSTTEALYVDVGKVFDNFEIDETDPENLVLKIGNASLPVSKDYLTISGKNFQLPGLTVYAPETKKCYISREAIKLIQKFAG